MSVISSVTSAAATLVAGLDSLTAISNKTVGLVKAVSDGLAAIRKPDALTVKLATSGAAGATAAAKATGAAKSTTAAKTSAAAKTTTAKTTTAKSTTAKSTTAAKTTSTTSGYATATGDDFAFLKDATLSVEEKLFRFMCAVAQRNDDEVLKKMEEMKGATAKAASGSAAGGAKKSSGSVWSALKALVPPLGMAAQLVGDTKLKSLVTQVSGPVLAAAATALGMPALAPLALQAGPALAASIVNGKVSGDEATAVASGLAGGASSGATTASGASASTTAAGKNEQVQLMELQRLVDKQKEMFAMISNVLRAQHDTRMAIIGNTR